MSSGLTSGITSGMPAILRNALAFENTWIPLATKDGSTTSATLFGSAEKAISTSGISLIEQIRMSKLGRIESNLHSISSCISPTEFGEPAIATTSKRGWS